MSTVPGACPSCIGDMELYRNKAGRPYLTCRPCKTQIFIRSDEALAKFSARYPEQWRAAAVMAGAPVSPTPDPEEPIVEEKLAPAPAPVAPASPAAQPQPQPKQPKKKGGSGGIRTSFFGR